MRSKPLLDAGFDPHDLDPDGYSLMDLIQDAESRDDGVFKTVLANVLGLCSVPGYAPVALNLDSSMAPFLFTRLLKLLMRLDFVSDTAHVLDFVEEHHLRFSKLPFDFTTTQGLFYVRSAVMVDVFVKRGADVKHVMYNGSTPASHAAAHGLFDVERRLVEHGADPMSFDREGRDGTPLSEAAHYDDLRTTLVLLERGAKPGRALQLSSRAIPDNEAWALVITWERDVLTAAIGECMTKPKGRARL